GVISVARRFAFRVDDARDPAGRVVGNRQELAGRMSQPRELVAGVLRRDAIAVQVFQVIDLAVGTEVAQQAVGLAQVVAAVKIANDASRVAGLALGEGAVGQLVVGEAAARPGRTGDGYRLVVTAVVLDHQSLFPRRVPAAAK